MHRCTQFKRLLLCLYSLVFGLVGIEAAEAQPIQMSIMDTSHTEYHATFTLASPPSPLQECRVTLTLEFVPASTDKVIDKDVTFNIWGTDENLQIVGDSVFTWPAPVHSGETITHVFGFVPRMSGKSWVIVSPGQRSIGAVPQGPRFVYCLDESGNLRSLNSPPSGQVPGCYKVRTYFLTSEMSSLTMAHPDQRKWQAQVTPVPRAGDTCRVQYEFVAPINWPAGGTIDIHAVGFALLTLPEPFDRSVSAGSSLNLELIAVADSVPGEDLLQVQLIPDLGDHWLSLRHMVQTNLCFLFDSNRELRYCGTGSQSARLETTRRTTIERYRIESNGELPIRRGSARSHTGDGTDASRH